MEQNQRALNGSCRVRIPRSDEAMFIHPCTAVFFDMDGVLVDSSTQIAQALAAWSLWTGVDVEGMQAEFQSMTDYDFVRLVAPHLDTELQVRQIQEREELLANNSRGVPGAKKLYAQVPGDLRAVVTNGCRSVACARLRSAGFKDPDVLITSDDVRRGKPDPEPYQKALDSMSLVAPSVVAVEDSIKGATSAKKAGLFVIGYDPDGGSHGLEEVADLVVASLGDITFHWRT
ncbi:HAD-IA family hydrolase [Geodermatophilus sp. DSM 44513]|uniref:HAD-IA family hydrolase n=1 Tax=Geodermatophilus sp. DSM 44513 TaxID=1528104 RepID=UPI0014130A04|nr:HAD-IA family hydrolase [Geodermatophilus sp. DSM 44513]WNV75287.1 HAD-IA family hydrolase [Geodermatophilus sp. DSM 44513]